MEFALIIVGSHAVQSTVDGSNAPAEFGAYDQAVIAAGVKVHGAPFNSVDTGRNVQVRDGQTHTTAIEAGDEYLGGYLVIDVPTLDDALDWAARCPATKYGRVEVRPIVVM